MAKASESKRGKVVAVQNNQSSEEESDGDIPKTSQSVNHIRTAENMVIASRTRREAKRKAIKTEHTQRVEKARAKITLFYEDRQKKITKLQNEQWEELGAMFKTRMSIEKAIFKNVAIIEQLTLNMANELDTVYAARLNDIVEMGATGTTLDRA